MKRNQSLKNENGSVHKPIPSNTPRDYIYSTLKDLLERELDRINVYAAVLDCSGIYYAKSIEKYMCTIKLIDNTLNPHSFTPGLPGFMSVTMFSRSIIQLPKPPTIGSILRIHRGQTKKTKDYYQLNCDVNIKGAWVVFDSANSIVPVSESGRTHTFTPKDKIRLGDIRKFAKNYFESYNLENITLDMGYKKSLNEFDTNCYVLDVKKKEQNTRILLCDNTKVAKLYLPYKYPISFIPSSVVRVRSTSFITHNHKTFLDFNDYSNIIAIPKEYMSAIELINIIKSEKMSKDVLEEMKIRVHDLSTSIVSHPLVKKSKIVHLKDLYSGSLTKYKERTFRVTVNVVEIGPRNPLDWIWGVDKSNNNYMLKDIKTINVSLEYYFKLRLFVRDNSSNTDNNLYVFFLCTVDGKGKEFIKLPQGKPEEEYFNKLKRIYKILIKPWSILDCIVEVFDTDNGQPIFFLVDTCLDLN